MNKKGWYAPFLVILVIAAVIIVYVELQSKTAGFGRYIGDTQSAILGVDNEVLFYEAYLTVSAERALTPTLADLFSSLEHQELAAAPLRDKCALLNTNESPRTLAHTPALHGGLTRLFNDQLNPYLERYASQRGWQIPRNNFEISIADDTVTIVALRPTFFPVRDHLGGTLGRANYKPSLDVAFASPLNLDSYANFFRALTAVAEDCSYASEQAACARDILGSGVTIQELSENTLGFTFLVDFGLAQITSPCYSLILPGKS